jgi:hypothetical protein
MDKNTGEGFVTSTPLLYTLMDSPMSQKSHKTTGAGTSNPALLLDNMFIQQYIYPNVILGRIGYGWDVMKLPNPSKIIFRVLDNTTIFHYMKDMDVIEWITPVSKMIDIGQLADLDVTIT